MCEVEDGDHLELFKKEKSLGTKCMKCKEGTAAIIIRVGDAFCRSCFKEYFVHKFRAMLGKNRVVYPGEKVLLAYSGGPSSSAMIQQVQEGLSRDAPKKLRFVPGILFVDEGAVCGQSGEDREKTVSEVEHVLRGTGFPFHIVALEEVLSLPSSVLQRTPPGSSAQKQNYKQAVGLFLEHQHGSTEESHITDQLAQLSTADSAAPRASDAAPNTASRSRPPARLTEELTQLFTQTKTLTAKQELLHTLRTHLILHTARSCGYSKVMSGESCTRLSVSLLSNISLGRGAFLPLDTGFSDSRFGDVTFIRPMREYSLKEISFNNRLFDVPSVFIPTLDTKASDNSSIQRLSETFITRLQADFPSTVSTVYRTSEKLNLSTAEKHQEDNRQEKCLMCLCPLDTCVGSASAFQATEVSQRLSQRTVYGTETPAKDCENTCGNAGQCCEQEKKVPAYLTRGAGTPGIFNMLCYSCRLTVKELKSLDKMPQYILHEAEHRSCRREMRKEIQEFLLEDADV
ncbi:cytoplasmic tRNA 2-thiolation protein 2 [Spea bombifrons]|uniref:cytoplasmic tRNA 2-thiolation protein 2 n=1 Tax=Spea bombifrons TaxID=233779 RepID=UPI00234B7D2D|nr:cytoplasmic tRNA 2-thiolation protein 2 [Spea bombifrons]